jgi:hypothetical protein
MPNELVWEQVANAERKVITITNIELAHSEWYTHLPRQEREPLLPTRRMVVDEERLLSDPAGFGDHLVTWEVGADSFRPTHGEMRFRDIPTVDERPAN